MRRVSEEGEWWKKDEWGELREKGEGGVFEKVEREAWREKSVIVALRGRSERGELALKLEKKELLMESEHSWQTGVFLIFMSEM